jgi:hypothetical protein
MALKCPVGTIRWLGAYVSSFLYHVDWVFRVATFWSGVAHSHT